MKGTGYNLRGKKVLSAKQVCQLNESIVGRFTDESLRKKKELQKGNSQIAKETYMNKGIIGLNIFATYLNKRYPKGGFTKDVILSWVKDIIKPEDIKKLQTYTKSRSNGEVSTDDDAR